MMRRRCEPPSREVWGQTIQKSDSGVVRGAIYKPLYIQPVYLTLRVQVPGSSSVARQGRAGHPVVQREREWNALRRRVREHPSIHPRGHRAMAYGKWLVSVEDEDRWRCWIHWVIGSHEYQMGVHRWNPVNGARCNSNGELTAGHHPRGDPQKKRITKSTLMR